MSEGCCVRGHLGGKIIRADSKVGFSVCLLNWLVDVGCWDMPQNSPSVRWEFFRYDNPHGSFQNSHGFLPWCSKGLDPIVQWCTDDAFPNDFPSATPSLELAPASTHGKTYPLTIMSLLLRTGGCPHKRPAFKPWAQSDCIAWRTQRRLNEQNKFLSIEPPGLLYFVMADLAN